jgi:hypothetical protein
MSAMGGKERKKKGSAAQAMILSALLLILAVLDVHYIGASRSLHGAEAVQQPTEASTGPRLPFTPAAQTPAASPTPTPTPTPTPLPPFEPHAVDATRPERLIAATAVQVNGQTVTDYRAAKSVDFGLGEDYTAIPGVFTFRGNNFRDGGAYGTVEMAEQKLSRV